MQLFANRTIWLGKNRATICSNLQKGVNITLDQKVGGSIPSQPTFKPPLLKSLASYPDNSATLFLGLCLTAYSFIGPDRDIISLVCRVNFIFLSIGSGVYF